MKHVAEVKKVDRRPSGSAMTLASTAPPIAQTLIIVS